MHVITALKGQAWGNKLDSSHEFDMEVFFGIVSSCQGIPTVSGLARRMAYLSALNETWLLQSAEYVPEYGGLLHPTTRVGRY